MQLAVNAGLPLLPLLDGQLGTIDAFLSCSSALYVPSKLDAQLLKEAQSSLVDLGHFDRECTDRCHLRHTAFNPARIYSAISRTVLHVLAWSGNELQLKDSASFSCCSWLLSPQCILQAVEPCSSGVPQLTCCG